MKIPWLLYKLKPEGGVDICETLNTEWLVKIKIRV